MVMAPACGAESPTAPDSTLDTGAWGGEHVLLSITASGATVEFDCAHAVIAQAITLKGGTFDVPGDYFPEHGGPVREDEPTVQVPSRFSGTVNGKSMTLRVTAIATGQDLGTFSLTNGAFGRVFKCV